MKDFKLRVRVRFKEGILDPQSEVIFQKLKQMEFEALQFVECEKSFLLGLKAEDESEATDLARQMAQQLLANVVMEIFEVEILR
jgi:phosphoribosylformylglycinamidine synthase